MRTIWKFKATLPVEADAEGIVRLVGLDPMGVMCVWIEVDSSAPTVVREFAIVGTGHPVPKGTHVGSFVDGMFVWHVYEVTK